jgi:GT2 family glycosyltransferase
MDNYQTVWILKDFGINMKYGMAISTYMREKNFPQRFEIFKECITSLLSTTFNGNIFIIDDGSETDKHLIWADEQRNEKIKIFKKTPNGGISKCKNTGIRKLLEHNNDYLFLCDDDMLFNDKIWYHHYIDALQNTNLMHLTFATHIDARATGSEVMIDNYKFLKTRKVNGCMLILDRKLIDKVGYFRVMPYKYGHEHSNFSIRCAEATGHKGFYDILGSEKWLAVNNKSGN